jgi:hypothetical protein
MKSKITAVLLSWKRKPNMLPIIDALRAQSAPVEIWLINNDGLEDFGADRLIAIPWNAGEWARYVFAARVETEYCMFQDDDFMLGDWKFLEDAIAIHEDTIGNFMLGTAGRTLNFDPPHYGADVHDGYAHILKGHFQLFRSNIVRHSRIPRHPSASDIYWSLDTGGGWASHRVSKELAERLMALDQHGVGYEFRPNHYQERERVCKEWLIEDEKKTDRRIKELIHA